MTDRTPERPGRVESDDLDREARFDETVNETESGATRRPRDDRGSLRDTAPNPHDEKGAAKTATQTGGAFLLAGAMWPAVILMIIAIAVILYFVL